MPSTKQELPTTIDDLEFKPENKAAGVFDIDSFKLQKDEKARIVILDEKAKARLLHFVRTPGEDDTRKGRYYVCIGSYKTVMTDGADSENCPLCRIAEPGRDGLVSQARRRCVLHIARYRTNGRGQVLQPVSLALQVWLFGDDKFNALIDRTEEHGDLRRHDISVTCTAQTFQKMDLDVSPKLIFMQDPAAVEQFKELRGQRSKELDRLLGTPLNFEQLERLVQSSAPVISDDDMAEAAEGAVKDVLADLDSVVPATDIPADGVLVADDVPVADTPVDEKVEAPAGMEPKAGTKAKTAPAALNLDELLGV